MTVRGVTSVIGAEGSKLTAQRLPRLVLAACIAGPFAFSAAIRVQSSMPEDTLFGRTVNESGYAVPLVVLGFAALWALPVVTSIVAGDIFSAEDRYGTWKMVLTRSRSRAEIFLGKLLTATAFSVTAVIALAASSIGAGLLVVGSQPLVGLSGTLLPPSRALIAVSAAWASVLIPALAFTALAAVVSVATRNSAAGIGVPVLIALVMQLGSFVDGPEAARRALITSAFSAWHGIFTEPAFYGPLINGAIVSAIYLGVCVAIAYRTLRIRDVTG